jgi:hypothetical protein
MRHSESGSNTATGISLRYSISKNHQPINCALGVILRMDAFAARNAFPRISSVTAAALQFTETHLSIISKNGPASFSIQHL